MEETSMMTQNNELKFKDAGVKLVKVVAERDSSLTQSVKTIIIEKEGKQYVSYQKWWRKSADQPWEESKGFHFTPGDVEAALSDLQNALLEVH
jgi:hypothetical protein